MGLRTNHSLGLLKMIVCFLHVKSTIWGIYREYVYIYIYFVGSWSKPMTIFFSGTRPFNPTWHWQKTSICRWNDLLYIAYLIGGLEHDFYFSIIYGKYNLNWLIFFRGVETTNQIMFEGHRLLEIITEESPLDTRRMNRLPIARDPLVLSSAKSAVATAQNQTTYQIWRFPKWWEPQIIHFIFRFSIINHPLIRIPPFQAPFFGAVFGQKRNGVKSANCTLVVPRKPFLRSWTWRRRSLGRAAAIFLNGWFQAFQVLPNRYSLYID